MCEHHTHCHSHSHENTSESISSVYRIIIAIFIFITGMILHTSEIQRFLIFFTAYIIAGGDVLHTAIKNILNKEFFDENFLMSIATLGAFGIKEYPEAVMVMILYQIGEYLQDKAVEKSRKSISELMDIRPDYANIIENGKIFKKSPENIKIGEVIIVKTGEKIPLDGIVIEGKAAVDTAALTGESLPKTLKTGSEAISGCININGVIKIKVTKSFGESTVSKILKLVENAGTRKAKAENFITKFAKIYTPSVVFGALTMIIVSPLIFGGEYSMWIQRALTFLVISCPCALVISVPLSFFAGIGGASKAGILIKGSHYLEALSKPDTVVFDKTGTLTKGSFDVIKIEPQNGFSKEELLKYTAMAENYSNHPIAESLKKAYSKTISNDLIKNAEEIAGRGVKALIEDNAVIAGNDKFMEDNGINYKKASEIGTVIYTALNGIFIGYIVIADEVKADSLKAINSLKRLGCQTIMLTGDSFSAADYIAQNLGMDKFYAKLLPSGKVEKLEEIIEKKQNDKSVLFVGDGINDAPVLTRADVGIAMGALGSDAAIEAADVVIMDDKPSKISLSINIARRTMSIVIQNISFAIGIKLLFLTFGAFGFISMWGAVFADVGVTLLAVMNSLRALYVKH
ncbi:MAG: cadmium-translocating P-type ATPase [Clostridium sp.]|nr:cadmium-translocating P-type ATPase [Clostridium sp.]